MATYPPALNLLDAFERVPVSIFPTMQEGAAFAAAEIALAIKARQAASKMLVLGLATGATPKAVYAELVRLHREESLSFKNVISFNLDEYFPIDKAAWQSYHSYMHRNLFQHIDIDPANIHIPNGRWPREQVKVQAALYEEAIAAAGGIDLQLLGIGSNGHIGFNEPGSSLFSKTRLINLENSTRLANAYEFTGISQVPRLAITMGIGTILKAKKILLLAWGPVKAGVVQKAVEGPVTESLPASLLQQHPDCRFVIDEAAAAGLTRYQSPWLTGEITWTPANIKKAVVNMALKAAKPVLSLTTADYNEYGLGDLLVEEGDAYEINLKVYYMLRDSITGWPGGKPNATIPAHPERSAPYPKTVLIFSPHPDDDIISMGGTFQRLTDQGHHVHVAYQTSGNIAVTDEFVTRYLDFAVGFEKLSGIDTETSAALFADVRRYFATKAQGQPDTPFIRSIKGLIRRGEASATCRYVGLPESSIHFMDLPFYETGTIEKAPKTDADMEKTVALLRQLQPQQIFAAGDLADPHGTHKVCLDVVLAALRKARTDGDSWITDCWLWLYKGAWQEWKLEEIEMAIPMSPDQVVKKRHGIFIHQSQKDMVPFQGSDSREFWLRAEERNAATADLYGKLGLTQYKAMEAFVRFNY